MPKLFAITEAKTRCGCCWTSNRILCLVFGAAQLSIAAASLSQHVYSLYRYRKIFDCQTNFTYVPNASQFLAYDIIIFDYGLNMYLLGTQECVANYMDGGYMRFLWCLSHTGAVSLLLLVLAMERPKLMFMYPAILQQSIYALGLIVLTLATLPKLLVAIFAEPQPNVLLLIFIFFCGMGATWFFTLVLWHWYWHLETVYEKDALEEASPDALDEEASPADSALNLRHHKSPTSISRDEVCDEEEEEELLGEEEEEYEDVGEDEEVLEDENYEEYEDEQEEEEVEEYPYEEEEEEEEVYYRGNHRHH